MESINWQLLIVLICVAGALWSVIARFRKLLAGQGGCGSCSTANSASEKAGEPKLVSEDQIEMLFESEKAK